MKNYDKNKESSYLRYWNVNNLYGWAISQKLPLVSFKRVEQTPQFNGDLIKGYTDDSDEGCFLQVDAQ